MAIKSALSRIFQALFFIIFSWIYVSIIITNSGNKPWLSALVGIGFLAAGIGAAFFCKKIAAKWKPKTIHFIFAGIAVVLLGIQIYFALATAATHWWDIERVYSCAIHPFDGKTWENYLAVYPNNTFITIILKIFFKFMVAITGNNSAIFGNILNTLFIFVSIVFIYLTATKLWGAHIGLLTAIICFFFAPFYTYTSFVYTDSFSLPFIVIPIYLYLRAITSKKAVYKYCLFASAGILLSLGFKLKATVIILLVAILIHLFLSEKILIALKGTAALLASFVIIFFSYNAVIKQLNIVTPENADTYQIPYTHWIMMGLNGYGGFNGADLTYTSSFPTVEERKNANVEEIKKRVSEMGFAGLVDHLTNKAVHNTWGDGTYHVYLEGKYSTLTDSKLWQVVQPGGKYYMAFYYYSQGFQLAMLTLLMISLGIGIKNGKINGTLLFKIALFGLFIFLLIWETRSRYLFHYTPLLLLISADTCNLITDFRFQNLKNKFLSKKKHLKSSNEETTTN